MIVWIIGLSGSGKTSIGRLVVRHLREAGFPCVLLDGDELRAAVGGETTYDESGRRLNSERMGKIGLLLERNQVVVVSCILSIFPEHREQLRADAETYFEVYIKTDLDDLRLRDYKGIYAQAFSGQLTSVVGLDIEFPEPQQADLVLENRTDVSDVEALALTVTHQVLRQIRIEEPK